MDSIGQALKQAWIDAFAKGIGDRKVVVILEPDGLGIIPFHTDLSGKDEWCKPPDADKATAAKERYEMHLLVAPPAEYWLQSRCGRL
ncbi:MAG TPA: hypothetical protein VFK02_35095 [Kofleriaceae bacterium]|nr:hypothetical protein [Kofleriaceae bacterium]